ncbi:hypothetical protein CEXT_751351 [Caerostris extrusa]|uniref:Uncharacterized protein n=1 Tax=Caerostris extrusa TaxID=172846 RepID=A0AAV4W6A7_CAEEX|nr:hypothetical protein CEXT_751351 [Caerostris extrusa]
MYQLAARMGTQASNTFTHTLLMLIRNISVDHPHHSLPVILALNNADKDPADKKKSPIKLYICNRLKYQLSKRE